MPPRNWIRWLCLPIAVLLGTTIAFGQQAQPLKPADRSSPRAALQTFLDAGDAFGEFAAKDYLPSPSRSKFARLELLGAKRNQGLDLSEVPPAARAKTGYAAANALYEVLSRIPLPPPDQIPDADQMKPAGNGEMQRWVIPDTEIALVRAKTGPRGGEFLFSADTVARANEFFERVRGLPYARPVPLKDIHDLVSTAGGWMIPYARIQALPPALRAPIAGQSAWKWIGLVLVVGLLVLFLAITYRLAQLGAGLKPFPQSLVRLAVPVAVLVAMPVVDYATNVQLVLVESVGSAVELATTAIAIFASAWLVWRLTSVIAEAIVASPLVGSESLDSHIVRGGVRLIGIGAAAALLAFGADRVGMPLYGIVAGLGVGGLAVALATQPTIENLIAGISLVADKAVRHGEYCKYGDALGTVERVGVRSTRIRGDDRTLANVPNAVLAKLPIVSLTRRDQMLIQTVLGLRYETTPEQLRQVLVNLRQLLEGDQRIDRDSARARLINFGDSSLDVEVFAYVQTTVWTEFLGIREDLLLRMMDIIEQAGTEMAFPSQTLYLARDHGNDSIKAKGAEANVEERPDKGQLG
ncbi:MAG TPA: mechanosensitive ion channel family protein [Casimicrobiaceae bacterium]|nr:mechanosensitive ion channel family protein [Casimicrobiaceae bacterium]